MEYTNVPPRFSLIGIIGGLMLSENLGDVHDEINHLHDLLGIPRPEGNFHEGWTTSDLLQVDISRKEKDITNPEFGI